MSDPQEARRRGQAGRARAVEKFGWDAIAAKTQQAYREIVEQFGAKSAG